MFPGTYDFASSVTTQRGVWKDLTPRWYHAVALHFMDSHMKVLSTAFPDLTKKPTSRLKKFSPDGWTLLVCQMKQEYHVHTKEHKISFHWTENICVKPVLDVRKLVVSVSLHEACEFRVSKILIWKEELFCILPTAFCLSHNIAWQLIK